MATPSQAHSSHVEKANAYQLPMGKGALGLKDTGAGMSFGNLHVRKL